jgi:hypothetical protein
MFFHLEISRSFIQGGGSGPNIMMMNHEASRKHTQQVGHVSGLWDLSPVEAELWTEHNSNRCYVKIRSKDRIIFPTSSLRLQRSRELIT